MPESPEFEVAPTALPEPEVAREWLQTMTLIRRFEERAGEMYARAKVGGFCTLRSRRRPRSWARARALRKNDYLISTYRSHGNALVRGTPPENVMAELPWAGRRLLGGTRRLDAHVRPRAPLHGWLWDRRRETCSIAAEDRTWRATTGARRT